MVGDVTLPCRNVVYPNCSSTLWDYTNSKDAVELVNHGKINRGAATRRARAKRLSLDSDCSLHITDVTTEDAGLYTCNSEDVYLYVLQGGCYCCCFICCCFQALRGSVTEVKWILLDIFRQYYKVSFSFNYFV